MRSYFLASICFFFSQYLIVGPNWLKGKRNVFQKIFFKDPHYKLSTKMVSKLSYSCLWNLLFQLDHDLWGSAFIHWTFSAANTLSCKFLLALPFFLLRGFLIRACHCLGGFCRRWLIFWMIYGTRKAFTTRMWLVCADYRWSKTLR